MSDKPFYSPWVAKHRDGNICYLGSNKKEAEKLFKQIGFDSNWKLEYIEGNMNDPKGWRETPCSLPSDFFNDK